METRKAYIDKTAVQLKQWDDELQRLQAAADQAKTEVKSEYARRVEDLRARRENIQHQLNDQVYPIFEIDVNGGRGHAGRFGKFLHTKPVKTLLYDHFEGFFSDG